MANLEPQERFKDRYAKLSDVINDATQLLDPNSNPFLLNFLNELLKFSNEYSSYFQKLPNITSSELNIALLRLQEEWSRISRACDQRRFPTFQPILKQMDAYADDYYKRFRGYKANKGIGPITYIEKYFEITRYAFTPHPLISVPLLYIGEDNNIRQSLAHEMGHFFYWNSAPINQYHDFQKKLKIEVANKLNNAAPTNANEFTIFNGWQDLSKRWLKWFEEVFADVSGTLFGGVGFFESACDIANEMTLVDLINDDGEHPIPLLRPLIAIKTLTWMSGQSTHRDFAPSPEEINHRKESWLKEIALKGVNTDHMITDLPFNRVEESISTVVQTILQEPFWSGKAQGIDNRQVSTNLGSLILPLPEPPDEQDDLKLTARSAKLDKIEIDNLSKTPFELLQERLTQRVIDESQKNDIVLDPKDPRIALLVRAAIIDLDLGDEAGSVINTVLPTPPTQPPPRHR